MSGAPTMAANPVSTAPATNVANPANATGNAPMTAAPDAKMDSLANDLEKAAISGEDGHKAVMEDAEEADSERPLTLVSGIHPKDKDAEVKITGAGTSETIYKSAQTFSELGLSEDLLKGVADMKFNYPSKIQAKAIPFIIGKERSNVVGQAHHGSGKTAAFALGMLMRVDGSKPHLQAMCVVPTRELAVQEHSVIQSLAKYTKMSIGRAVKGEKGVVNAQICVGTPGTILAKFRHRELDPRGVIMFVVDEADEMISDKGKLAEQTVQIFSKITNRNVQTLLFSATFPERVLNLANRICPRAVRILVEREQLTLEGIKQFYLKLKEQEKPMALRDLLLELSSGQTIVFCRTVAAAKDLTNQLRQNKFSVSILHGRDMAPDERERVMADFRANRTTVLVTTNVLARGIDVLQVRVVVNYDLPTTERGAADAETYLHRIGRTGRFGMKGAAINFISSPSDLGVMQQIAQHYNCPMEQLAGDAEAMAAVIKKAM